MMTPHITPALRAEIRAALRAELPALLAESLGAAALTTRLRPVEDPDLTEEAGGILCSAIDRRVDAPPPVATEALRSEMRETPPGCEAPTTTVTLDDVRRPMGVPAPDPAQLQIDQRQPLAERLEAVARLTEIIARPDGGPLPRLGVPVTLTVGDVYLFTTTMRAASRALMADEARAAKDRALGVEQGRAEERAAQGAAWTELARAVHEAPDKDVACIAARLVRQYEQSAPLPF